MEKHLLGKSSRMLEPFIAFSLGTWLRMIMGSMMYTAPKKSVVVLQWYQL